MSRSSSPSQTRYVWPRMPRRQAKPAQPSLAKSRFPRHSPPKKESQSQISSTERIRALLRRHSEAQLVLAHHERNARDTEVYANRWSTHIAGGIIAITRP